MRRRWWWAVGGGLLGLALAGGAHSLKTRADDEVQANLIVDVAQGPCYSRSRQLNTFKDPSVVGMRCYGELEMMRLRLDQLAQQSGSFDSNVAQLAIDAKGKENSSTQLVLSVTAPSNLAPQIAAALAQIQQEMTRLAENSAKANGFDPFFGSDWIQIEEPTKVVVQSRFHRTLALGLLGGLVAGAGSALIADQRSNRVYSQAELLGRLGHPLRLGLPAGPWTSPAVQVLVGQLATQLDQALSWRVMSIARQHDAVAPLTQLL